MSDGGKACTEDMFLRHSFLSFEYFWRTRTAVLSILQTASITVLNLSISDSKLSDDLKQLETLICNLRIKK